MLGNQFTISTGAVALTGAATKTVLMLRGATGDSARVTAWGVSFDGATSTATPVAVRVTRCSTDGTSSGTPTAIKTGGSTGTPAATLGGATTFSVEPTVTGALWEGYVHPQGGSIHMQLPQGREYVLSAVDNDNIAIEITPPANVNCRAYLTWEE